MEILMFGWEFPPFSSGGLGTACYGLTRGLTNQGVDITFVLPRIEGALDCDYMRILAAEKGRLKFKTIDAALRPYMTSKAYNEFIRDFGLKGFEGTSLYGRELFEEVDRYARAAEAIAEDGDFDVIHCHDWMTYRAGIHARKAAEKMGRKVPLIAHIHSTEFDRTGGHPQGYVYYLEWEGLREADYIVAVSDYTKGMVVRHYSIDPKKIHVIHNAIDYEEKAPAETPKIKEFHKIVLFLGRITIQKGPDHFLRIAKRIAEVDDNVRFIVVGSGDMFRHIVEESANLGIGDKVLFADFLSGKDVERAYRMAHVYVMPSISEPFGLTALEAMKYGTPVVISKQSGVSEVIKNCLVVDFWDVNRMVDRIMAVLKYKELRDTMSREGVEEIKRFSWREPAKKCLELYRRAMKKKW
ncbi:MAG: glycosyltransferase family 4 protein [Candidatus Altiarchaeota archaeon]|nr:glycosyltransferase family 4 protein [Candidatus Altiarchaeota archaeon]MBU4437612.1 glycosyltransferase family 4 protein [Candidatus Altiarchaeota archaeon]